MRGKGKRSITGAELLRITPAYAGKRKTKAGYHTVTRDHPRLCGEKGEKVGDAIGGAGSPPPMRGKAAFPWQKVRLRRITPAYAGKSIIGIAKNPLCRDHPRLCGEKASRTLGQALRAGSPPPMRGKDGLQVRVCQRSGITPAYAGKSGLHDVLPVPSEDHPRLCGEK